MVEGGPARTILAARTTATGEGRPWKTAEEPASCDQSDGRSVEAHPRSNISRTRMPRLGDNEDVEIMSDDGVGDIQKLISKRLHIPRSQFEATQTAARSHRH